MVDLSRYDALIFDMDGTLIDSMGDHGTAWVRAVAEFGYNMVQPSYFDEMGGVPSYQIVVQLNEMHGLNHDPLEVAERKYEIWEEIKSLPALIPATNAILDQNQGIKPISIGTGARRPDAIRTLTDLNLLHKLTHVVTSSDVEKGKPHPDTFLKAATLMGVDPSKCVVFEDTEIGRQAATAAGMDCILVERGELVHYPL